MNKIEERIVAAAQGSGGYERPNVDVGNLESALWLSNNEGLAYLKDRGLAEETIRHFRLGYDKKRDAIAIPVFKDKELVDVKYRKLHPKDKNDRYIREPKSETWVVNEEAFEKAKQSGRLLITEGEFDAMMAWQSGVKNVVSPTSGVSAVGTWVNRLINIPKVYIAFDNDKQGKKGAKEFSKRIGEEKAWVVELPDGIKDTSEYLKHHDAEDFRNLCNSARRAIADRFPHISDILAEARNASGGMFKVPYLDMDLHPGWVAILFGKTNSGKTSFVLNLASWMVDEEIPTLILPFERGAQSVGNRFLTTRYDKPIKQWGEEDFSIAEREMPQLPLYFYNKRGDEHEPEVLAQLFRDAWRIFGVKAIMVDHLDYLIDKSVRHDGDGEAIKAVREVCEDTGQVAVVVHQGRKVDAPGAKVSKRLRQEDIRGSQRLLSIPEINWILHDEESHVVVETTKNKGDMPFVNLKMNYATGKIQGLYSARDDQPGEESFADVPAF